MAAATGTDDLCYRDLAAVADLLAQRKLSPVELCAAVLARIERVNPLLNAFISVTADEARAAARQAEQEIGQGRYRGPLHGVPISLKDLYAMRGVRNTGGSKILADWVPDFDATATARLREAGAVIVGKTNLHEWAMGSTSINPHYGPVRNPWDRARIPQGSSGGSAAAVVAGLSYMSMGSETGGSIRRPAAFCGVVGLKPTYGRVSRYGILPAAWSLDHAGPLTRSVRDAAISLNVLAGYDPLDPASSARPVPDYTAELGQPAAGLRLGVPVAYVEEGVEPAVRDAFWAAVKVLEGLGAQRVDVELPKVKYASVVSTAVMAAEEAANHRQWFPSRVDDYGDEARALLATAMCLTADDYLRAQRARRAIANEVAAALRTVDVLVAPSAHTPATLIAEGSAGLHERPNEVGYHPQVWNRLISLLGLPVISVPCGFAEGDLPIGIQIAGRPFAEATILRLAAAYEGATDWHTRRPPLP